MNRITLGLFCTGLLALNACNSTETTSTTTDSEVAGNNATLGDTTAAMMPADSGAGSAADARTAPATLNGSTLDDKQFMIKADQGGHNEIGLSKLALEKGVTGHAKTFANQMIADHTKAGNELKPIAQKKNVTLPGDMDAEHKAIRDQLSKMSGTQFEQAYMDQMVKDHVQTVALLQSEIQGGQDTEAKAWAQKTLPVVQQHTNMAEQHSKMKM